MEYILLILNTGATEIVICGLVPVHELLLTTIIFQ